MELILFIWSPPKPSDTKIMLIDKRTLKFIHLNATDIKCLRLWVMIRLNEYNWPLKCIQKLTNARFMHGHFWHLKATNK